MKKNDKPDRPCIAALLCAALLAFAAPASAQTKNVYRCGTSYSNEPCTGGKVVSVDDARTAAQRADTDKAAKNDAKAAATMEKARLKEEAKPAQALIPPAKAEEVPATDDGRMKPVSATKAKAKKKSKEPEHFTAVSPRKPGDAPAKKKKSADKKSAA